MTTERRVPKREAVRRVSPLELRLYVAAFLAAVYTISWRAIGGPAPTTDATSAPAIAPEPQQGFVWFDSLPPTARPVIVLPVGWQVASDPVAPSASPPRVVQAPSRRVPRVRTRSS